MNTPTTCPRCSAPLPSPDASCPACLLSMGADADATHFIDAEKLPEQVLRPGQIFGGYRIEGELGRGGMGAVFAATELASGRRIALKVLSQRIANADARARFLREGRVAASINHANSVYIFGTEEIEGRSVITMELIGGGTLQQRVAEKGPLPVGEAVDAILDIIAGLEAAEAAGVLHRDIKPANCFIDTDGVVKVGDFGLSISTEGNRELDVTQMGVFLGTPAFCSPEQLRGEPLDVRSDIYAVGVTLYYLLTGHTPFDGANVMQLMANALDKAPRDPAKLRPGLPKEIVSVLLRCLAKQAGNRPADYAALRGLLTPFRSAAPTPTSLGLRCASWLIDTGVETLLSFGISLWIFDDALAQSMEMNWQRWVVWAGFVAILVVPQGLWGATLGQALMRLRVVRADRSAPGLLRALGRYSILHLPSIAIMVMLLQVMSSHTFMMWVTYSIPVYRLLMFCTIRRRNGYAAVHDLLTGTRVVEKNALQTTPLSADTLEAAAQPAAGQIGPYQLLATLETRPEHTLHLGFDPRLMRRVWVKVSAQAVCAASRQITRYSRLRWLADGTHEGMHWDAYEAPHGMPLTQHLQRPQEWSVVRHWLNDLATEIDAARADGTLPLTLSLDHFWVTAEGRLKLLDFPAPGSTPTPAVEAELFINHLALAALEGRVPATTESAQRSAAAPVPPQARVWLEKLRHTPPAAALHTLRPLLGQPALVTRMQRAALLLIPGLFTFIALVGSFFARPFMDRANELHARHPQLSEAGGLMMQYRAMEMISVTLGGLLPEPKDNDPLFALMKTDKARALHLRDVLLASRYGRFVRDEAVWRKPEMRGLLIQNYSELEEAVTAHPNPAPEDIAEAERVFKELLKATARGQAKQKSKDPMMSWRDLLRIAFGPLLFFGFCSLLLTLFFRRGILPRAFHIDYVTDDGRPAGRLRLLMRGMLAWLPAALLTWQIITVKEPVSTTSEIAVSILAASVVMLCLHSLLLRRRGLHDLIARVWPVPG